MNHKETYGIFPDKTTERISLLKYSKSSCGVDFLLNTAESTEKRGWFDTDKRYKTDFFEFYFFHKAEGHLFLAGERIELHPGTVLIVSPFQLQKWHVDLDKLNYTFLVFQEEFVNNFLSNQAYIIEYQRLFILKGTSRILTIKRSRKENVRCLHSMAFAHGLVPLFSVFL